MELTRYEYEAADRREGAMGMRIERGFADCLSAALAMTVCEAAAGHPLSGTPAEGRVDTAARAVLRSRRRCSSQPPTAAHAEPTGP